MGIAKYYLLIKRFVFATKFQQVISERVDVCDVLNVHLPRWMLANPAVFVKATVVLSI
jgi:hypothetical protein